MNIGDFERAVSSTNYWVDEQLADNYASYLLDYIETCYDFSSIDTVSVDVFDTLLLRNDVHEFERYYQITNEFVIFLHQERDIVLDVWDLYAARLMAFRIGYRCCKQKLGVREGVIDEILLLMLKIMKISQPESLVKSLIEIELNYELTTLGINQLLNKFFQLVKDKEKKLIFISDIYLSKRHIQKLIDANYLPFHNIQNGYSSADCAVTKSSGLLYVHSLADLEIAHSSVLHLGDNLVSDVTMAKKHGLNAIHLPVPMVIQENRKANKENFLQYLENNNFDSSFIW